MAGYTKLFHSILASTIWRADDKTRIVWITLLAMSDKHGIAEGSIPGLADFAHVSIPDCERALAELSGPDKYSRSQEHDGRRITPVDGGWQLVNHGKYREKMNTDERREYLRVKQAEYRAKRRKQVSTKVNKVSDTDTLLTDPSPTPDPDTTILTSKNQLTRCEGANGNGHDEPDAAKTFLAWFHEQYRTDRHGADYLVHKKKDEPIVRALLKHYPVERLQNLARILLSDKTDDLWIQGTDRGISVLKVKANWLNLRLAEWESKRAN